MNQNSLSQKWEEMYKHEKNGMNYGGDFNDGILKEPISVNQIVRFNSNVLKWNQLLNILGQHNYRNLEAYKILDIGCGNGRDLRMFCEFGGSPQNCYGIDFVKSAIDYAKENSPKAMHYSHGDFFENKYADNKFTIIFLFNTLANIIEDDEILRLQKEINRILEWNGLLFVIYQPSDEGFKEDEGKTIKDNVLMPHRMYEYKELQDLFPSLVPLANMHCTTGNMKNQKWLQVFIKRG